MNRRDLILGVSAAGLLSPYAGKASAAPLDLRAAAGQAWIYGLALIENAGSRTSALQRALPGRLVHGRELTTPATQSVTTPNNDTLYSRAWIDLSHGPATIVLPKTGDRYFSAAFMDMYANNFAVLGTRTTGPGGGRFTLVGPQDATGDPRAIRSPTPWVWMLVRTLIDGPADLPAAHAIQDAIQLVAPAAPKPPAAPANDASWAEYFTGLQRLILENPPPATDDAFFERVAALGLSPRGGFDAGRFDATQGAEIARGVAEARARLLGSRRQGPMTAGWLSPKANCGNFGQDYAYRGQIAVGGLAALPPDEAIYMRPVGEDGRTIFDSARPWRLSFPADRLPPVNAFWSLTIYEATEGGQFFLVDNSIDRYAIGDRTPGLKRGSDGALDIWIGRQAPGLDRRSNWLPAPSSRPLSLVLRTYMPKPDLIEGRYVPPPLQPA